MNLHASCVWIEFECLLLQGNQTSILYVIVLSISSIYLILVFRTVTTSVICYRQSRIGPMWKILNLWIKFHIQIICYIRSHTFNKFIIKFDKEQTYHRRSTSWLKFHLHPGLINYRINVISCCEKAWFEYYPTFLILLSNFS